MPSTFFDVSINTTKLKASTFLCESSERRRTPVRRRWVFFYYVLNFFGRLDKYDKTGGKYSFMWILQPSSSSNTPQTLISPYLNSPLTLLKLSSDPTQNLLWPCSNLSPTLLKPSGPTLLEPSSNPTRTLLQPSSNPPQTGKRCLNHLHTYFPGGIRFLFFAFTGEKTYSRPSFDPLSTRFNPPQLGGCQFSKKTSSNPPSTLLKPPPTLPQPSKNLPKPSKPLGTKTLFCISIYKNKNSNY